MTSQPRTLKRALYIDVNWLTRTLKRALYTM